MGRECENLAKRLLLSLTSDRLTSQSLCDALQAPGSRLQAVMRLTKKLNLRVTV